MSEPRDSVSAPKDSSNRLFILAVAAIAVIGLAAVAVLATTRGDDTAVASDGAETAAVELIGESISPLPEGVRVSDADTDPEYGNVAPTLIGTGFDGAEVKIEPDGKAKAIYFLAHWCPHCQEELPLVQSLLDDGVVPDGLEVYAVSTGVNDGGGNYPPSDWFVDEGFTATVVRDDDAASAFVGYGGAGFPYVVYLDSEHRVVARSSGNLDGATTSQLWDIASAG
ncbi:MAG: TlpA family protein disulfide reductase [Acidimicrobiales bacterium]